MKPHADEIPDRWEGCTIEGSNQILTTVQAAAVVAEAGIGSGSIEGDKSQDKHILTLANSRPNGDTTNELRTAFKGLLELAAAAQQELKIKWE